MKNLERSLEKNAESYLIKLAWNEVENESLNGLISDERVCEMA